MLAILLLGVVSLGAFLYVETIVPDPLLPLSLFSNRAFVIATAIGFIVGMALFGSITLLPVYLQVVKGLDPTSAGLHLTPMMLGVFVSSIFSGQIITRIGRYRIFPICGTALMTIALILLSRVDVATPPFTASGYMLLLGLGLGMVMQILVMAVQNAVKYEQLGVATSGTTLFRSIGGAVGAALFGGIFAFALEANIAQAMPNAVVSLKDPAAIAALAEPMRTTYLALFVDALHPVFRTAAALAFVSFLLSLGIKEVPLRTSIAPQPVGDAIETPRDATSLEELKRIVTRLTAGENRWQVYKRTAARMGLTLEPDELWMLARIGEVSGRTSTPELEQRLRIDGTRCKRLVDGLVAAGMATGFSSESFELSDKGRAEYQQLVRQREQDLKDVLADWEPDEHPDVREMMRQLAKSFASTPPARPGAA
jgi:DNA-binding MarR family transcriptional regulator